MHRSGLAPVPSRPSPALPQLRSDPRTWRSQASRALQVGKCPPCSYSGCSRREAAGPDATPSRATSASNAEPWLGRATSRRTGSRRRPALSTGRDQLRADSGPAPYPAPPLRGHAPYAATPPTPAFRAPGTRRVEATPPSPRESRPPREARPRIHPLIADGPPPGLRSRQDLINVSPTQSSGERISIAVAIPPEGASQLRRSLLFLAPPPRRLPSLSDDAEPAPFEGVPSAPGPGFFPANHESGSLPLA